MTEPSDLRPAIQGDALSEVLNTIRLRGEHIFRSSIAAGASAIPAATPALHIVEAGVARLTSTFDSIRVGPGELVLLPRGGSHRIDADEDLRWITGTIAYDTTAAVDQLLGTLPPVIVLRLSADDPREWLEVSSRLLLAEVVDPLPGGQVMVSRIIDLLFVQALRSWSRGPGAAPGWLSAAMDPQLGRVIAAVHRHPERPWTVASMAAQATMSRSAFAQRFTRAVGVTPVQYLTERRLAVAATLLVDTTTPIRIIAEQTGYTSEAAFSRAFRRRHGTSPMGWRQGRGASIGGGPAHPGTA